MSTDYIALITPIYPSQNLYRFSSNEEDINAPVLVLLMAAKEPTESETQTNETDTESSPLFLACGDIARLGRAMSWDGTDPRTCILPKDIRGIAGARGLNASGLLALSFFTLGYVTHLTDHRNGKTNPGHDRLAGEP